MATLIQNSISSPTSAPLPPDLEPDEVWKQTLKLNIEAGLRSMVDEAKQKLNDELARTLVSPEQRERLTADHLATLKTIRQLAEEQFRIALERERQERRWASGEQLDRAWSESMMKEQQAILDRIEMERKNKPGPSLQPDASLPPFPPPAPPAPPPPPPFQPKPDPLPENVTPNRKHERIARTPTQIIDPDSHSFSPSYERDEPDEIPPVRSTRKVRAGSITSISSWKAPSLDDKSLLGKPLYDEPRTDAEPRRESIRRKPSMNARPIVQEFWKPSITPEEDAQMSRTFTLARRSSTASATSSFKAPSVLHAAFSDPLDVNSERADQEWDRVRERDRAYDDRQIPSASPPSSATYTRDARVHAPPPSASRPIANKRSFTIDDFPQSSPTSTRWARERWEGSSRSPDDARWQPTLRGRFSTQDMRHYFQEHRPVREDFEEDGFDDGFGWRSRDYNERRIQDIEEGLRKREEAANRREEELTRKAEELKREDDARKKRAEEQRREDELWRLEEEARQREDEETKEEKLRRKEEEANRKEREAAMRQEEASKKEEEARKKEEEAKKKEEEVRRKEKETRNREIETRRKEEEVRRKEQEARSREMEARRKEEDARRKEEEVRMMEEEARRKEFEARRKQEEAERKEEEAQRRTEEISIKAEETRKKEEELREREEELRRREEDLNRREGEMRRREGDKLQGEFRKREEEIRRQRAEDKKKQEVWETWPQETFRPTPPQTPNSSGPWPIPNRNERSGSTSSPPVDRVSTSASGRNNPAVSGWSSASARSSSTTSTQTSSTPKPTTPVTPTPKPPTSSALGPMTEAEFHRRQAEQAQQREEQFRREQARLAMQEHERQTKSGKTMSKEEVLKLFEAHRGQWEKLATLGSLIWEDFPWPMFKRPKSPEDLTSPGITAYMLSSVHSQDRATKERIKDNIRRWHPDRFNAQFLPKVKENERERVSEGAGSVARILNDLLRMHSQDAF